MGWLLSLVVALLTAVAGCLGAGFLADVCVGWYRISSREGGSGYFILFMGLLGLVAGFVVGLICARVVAASAQPGFLKALGLGLGASAGLLAVIAALAWLAADFPPRLEGRLLVVEAEVRLPPGRPRPVVGEGELYSWHVTLTADGPGRRQSLEPLRTRDAALLEGRWSLPTTLDLDTTDPGKSLGVKLGGADLRGIRGGDAGYGLGSSGNRVAFGGNYNAITSTTGQTDASGLTSLTSQFVNLPASGLAGATPASFAISLFSSAANRFLNLEISALEADGKGRVVSSPRVVTADQTKALIEQGTEFPYEQATSSGATSIAFRKAVLKLEVTPQITPEGNIILDLDVNKDSPGTEVRGGMSINTKRVKTQVLVENGGTVVIGGIFELTERESENKVPVLGDVPVLGNLFKQRTRQAEKQEMLVFITPKMISDRGAVR